MKELAKLSRAVGNTTSTEDREEPVEEENEGQRKITEFLLVENEEDEDDDSLVRTAAFSTGKYHFSRSKSAFYLVYMPQISLKKSLITHPKKVGFTDKYKVSQGLHCCHSLAFSSYGQPELGPRDNLTP